MSASLFSRDKNSHESGTGNIVVGGTAAAGFWRSRGAAVLTGCVIVLLGACVSTYLWLRPDSRSTEAQTSTSTLQTQTLQEAAQLDHEGHYADEAAALKKYLATNPPRQYRYQPLVTLADLAYSDHQYSQAIEYNKQAEAAAGKMQEADAAGIAEAAQAEGDKTAAIHYYQQAIKLTKVQPRVANSIDDYKAAIKYLGGTT